MPALALLLALCLSLLASPARGAPPLEVIYPRVEERPQDAYGYQLLELALRKNGEPYALRLSAQPMGPERARRELQEGRVSVLDFGVSPEFEERFEAVYFPIDLGLSGYRRLIVRSERAAEFGRLRERSALRRYKAGQGPGWADTRILMQSGIQVDTAPFDALFRMLEARRFDFFPLGIEEAEDQLQRHRALAPGCAVLDAPVLHYRFARMYFVATGNTRLRLALQRGLERAFEDGSLRQLLASSPTFAPLLAAGRAPLTTVIELPNPWLSPRFRAIPGRYFVRL